MAKSTSTPANVNNVLKFNAPPPPERQKANGILDKSQDLQYAISQLADMTGSDRPAVGRQIVWAGLESIGQSAGLVLMFNDKDKRYEFYTDSDAQGFTGE